MWPAPSTPDLPAQLCGPVTPQILVEQHGPLRRNQEPHPASGRGAPPARRLGSHAPARPFHVPAEPTGTPPEGQEPLEDHAPPPGRVLGSPSPSPHLAAGCRRAGRSRGCCRQRGRASSRKDHTLQVPELFSSPPAPTSCPARRPRPRPGPGPPPPCRLAIGLPRRHSGPRHGERDGPMAADAAGTEGRRPEEMGRGWGALSPPRLCGGAGEPWSRPTSAPAPRGGSRAKQGLRPGGGAARPA